MKYINVNGALKAAGCVVASASITIIAILIIAWLVRHDKLPDGRVPVNDQDRQTIQQFEKQ